MSDQWAELLDAASRIPWFKEVGQSLPNVVGRRLSSWEEWPGPEDEGVERLALDLQEIRDSIEDDGKSSLEGWENGVKRAVAIIARSVPAFRPEGDAWHAPTAAAWQAAWVIGLRAAIEQSGGAMPQVLKDQVQWFEKGHWPAGYASRHRPADMSGYLVF